MSTPIDLPNLRATIESRWAELHTNPDHRNIFRYQLAIERERTLPGRFGFLTQLNPKRMTERRKPEVIRSLRPPFEPERFHFNKVDEREVMGEVTIGGTAVSLLINNSPLTEFHTLLVPEREANLAQVLTKVGVEAAVRVMLEFKEVDYRIGFNSPGALASVNHLHLHLLLVKHRLYVEDAPLTPLGNNLYRLDDCPAKAYCFQLEDPSSAPNFIALIYRAIELLLDAGIAHNLFFTWNSGGTVLRALVYPRSRPCEYKQVLPLNVAFCELSGYVPLADPADYDSMTERRLEEHFGQVQGADVYREVEPLLVEGLRDLSEGGESRELSK
ncbi:D330012F22Rik protein [Culex quinquefasciatus]|uniref:GDP-D-glucose phosphorylase 1 n=1 Tax=Culex quinquefasciatus TaxID=7176 RepID=B0X8E0_CULQU|nr:D330012F22Rik protein [Culex quinquefasciatus]|eukprot:XP_001865912.1 D330012F22Rik protein [Culex quinquefasciatus]